MRPIRTAASNVRFVGEEDGSVEPMYAEAVDGTTYSTWEPTPEERRQIAEGSLVRLGVLGGSVPPVSLAVAAPDSMVWSEELQTFVRSETEDDVE